MSVHHSDDCGEEREYKFRAMRANKIRFSVQASNDASICFSRHDDGNVEEMYEVFLGGWEGAESGIRKGGSDDVVRVDTPDLISADESRSFWIKISRGTIKVGKKGKIRSLMTFEDPEGLKGFRYYGYCTAYGAEGDWMFSDDKGEDSSSSSSSSAASSSDSEAEELNSMEKRPIMYKRPARWVPGHGGHLPRRAVEVGEGESGSMGYVGMALHEDAYRVGLVVPEEGVIHIPMGGDVASTDDYYVLGVPMRVDLKWKAASGGSVPAGALQAGHSEHGLPLYIGRVMFDGKATCGRVCSTSGLCFVPYGGAEHSHREYEVLCAKGMPVSIRS